MKISIMICFVTIKDKQFRKLPLFFSTFSIFHLPKTLFFCWPQDFCLAINPICSVFETKKFSIAKKQKFLTPKCNKLLQVECKKGGGKSIFNTVFFKFTTPPVFDKSIFWYQWRVWMQKILKAFVTRVYSLYRGPLSLFCCYNPLKNAENKDLTIPSWQ